MAFSDITTPDKTVEAEAMQYQQFGSKPVEVVVFSGRFLNLPLYVIFYLSVLMGG